MLYQLGVLTFEVWPFNTDEVQRQSGADYAVKELLGRRRGREYVGDGDERVILRGRLFPQVLGGLDGLAALDAMRAAGTPQILVRGDGANLGWFVVERVHERNTRLDGAGIGRIIEYDIELMRTDAPEAGDYVSTLMTLFG